MAKRFTDTEKWKKPFIRSLQAPYKLLFLYILDECNHAGIWQVELDIASLRIGEPLEYNLAAEQLKDHIIELRNGEKWFIPDFVEFQYGQLNPENRAHNSVIIILDKYKLLNKNKHLKSPLQGCKDMDKDKEMDKDIFSYTEFLVFFNQTTNRNFRGDSKSKTHFSARLKDEYCEDDFKMAVKNCMKDDFHKNNPQYLTPEFILRPDKIEKYINYKSGKTESSFD